MKIGRSGAWYSHPRVTLDYREQEGVGSAVFTPSQRRERKTAQTPNRVRNCEKCAEPSGLDEFKGALSAVEVQGNPKGIFQNDEGEPMLQGKRGRPAKREKTRPLIFERLRSRVRRPVTMSARTAEDLDRRVFSVPGVPGGRLPSLGSLISGEAGAPGAPHPTHQAVGRPGSQATRCCVRRDVLGESGFHWTYQSRCGPRISPLNTSQDPRRSPDRLFQQPASLRNRLYRRCRNGVSGRYPVLVRPEKWHLSALRSRIRKSVRARSDL